MAHILHFPHPVLSDQSPFDPTYFDSHDPLSREELKDLLKATTTQGDSLLMAGVVRRPFAGELVTFPTPDTDPEHAGTEFQIKRCGVNENIIRQNLSSTVRYVNRDETGEFVTERDYPIGDLNFETVRLGLAGWNLLDDNNAPIPLTTENIKSYLSPVEFDGIYQKILDVNPMWGRGESETKKS